MVNKIITFLIFVFLIPGAIIAQDRKKVALVLGGGGAKGAATVGVLKYVEEAGIPVDYVVGTSIGSIVGGMYCAGYRSAELDSMFRSQNWLSLFTDMKMNDSSEFFSIKNGVAHFMGLDINLLKKKFNTNSAKDSEQDTAENSAKKRKEDKLKMGIGVLSGDSIVNAFREMLMKSPGLAGNMNTDSLNFDSLPIPFRCVAVDVNELREVHLDHGSLATAMRASMAIPFVFRPIKMDGMTLVDGGVMNNLPVDVAKAMGADVIIAIDLAVEKDERENFVSLPDVADTLLSPLKKTGLFNLMKWGIERPDVRKYQENASLIDLYINPDLKGYGAQSFSKSKIAEMITLGEKAGKEAFEKLVELRTKL